MQFFCQIRPSDLTIKEFDVLGTRPSNLPLIVFGKPSKNLITQLKSTQAQHTNRCARALLSCDYDFMITFIIN